MDVGVPVDGRFCARHPEELDVFNAIFAALCLITFCRLDVLAFFDRPGTSNGPTEAINGRVEHLRGSAFGVGNLTNYITGSLLEAGGFRPHLYPRMR